MGLGSLGRYSFLKTSALILYYSIFKSWSDKLAGCYFRSKLLGIIFDDLGADSKILSGSYFGDGTGVVIGSNVVIGPNSRFVLGGKVGIGACSQLGPNVTILTGNHIIKDRETPFSTQGSYYRDVLIGEDVWIGANVTILPGVIIEKGAVIGAGAVVTKPVSAFKIVAGNPARVIGER